MDFNIAVYLLGGMANLLEQAEKLTSHFVLLWSLCFASTALEKHRVALPPSSPSLLSLQVCSHLSLLCST